MSHQRRSDLDSFFRSVYDSLARKVLEAESAGKPKQRKSAAAGRESDGVAPAPRLAKSRSSARSSGR